MSMHIFNSIDIKISLQNVHSSEAKTKKICIGPVSYYFLYCKICLSFYSVAAIYFRQLISYGGYILPILFLRLLSASWQKRTWSKDTTLLVLSTILFFFIWSIYGPPLGGSGGVTVQICFCKDPPPPLKS
jgi:hypothetical protein